MDYSGGSRIFQVRGRQPQRRVRQPIILAIFSWKLHEIETNWSERGHASLAAPLDPPMY